jgi:hypothetical protein
VPVTTLAFPRISSPKLLNGIRRNLESEVITASFWKKLHFGALRYTHRMKLKLRPVSFFQNVSLHNTRTSLRSKGEDILTGHPPPPGATIFNLSLAKLRVISRRYRNSLDTDTT